MMPPKRVEAWFQLSANVRLELEGPSNGPSGFLAPDRGIVLGGRVTHGSEVSYGTAIHEMAHMVNIDDRRVRQPGWGFKHGHWVSCPTRYCSGFHEMVTDAAIRRELDVMAIQAVITEHCRFNFDYEWWAALLSCGALQNYYIWRNTLGLTREDEQYKVTTVIDAGILIGMRELLTIEEVWKEWQRKTRVVDQQVRRAKRRDRPAYNSEVLVSPLNTRA